MTEPHAVYYIPLSDNAAELEKHVTYMMRQESPEEADAWFRNTYHHAPYRIYQLRNLVFIQAWPDPPEGADMRHMPSRIWQYRW